MSRFASAFLPLFLMLCIPTQAQQSLASDKLEIKQLLMKEALVLDHCAYKQFKSYWKPAPYVYISVRTAEQSYVVNNWLDLLKWINKQQKNCSPSKRSHVMDNYSFAIKNHLAIVTYRQDVAFAGKAILEKENGQWRLVRKSLEQITPADGLAQN